MTSNVNPLMFPPAVWEALQNGDVQGAKNHLSTYLDTLQEDERKAAINFFVHVAGMPTLMPPKSTDISMEVEKSQSKQVSDLLDNWIKQIAKEGKRIREEIGSPRFQQWLYEQSDAYQARVERENPTQMHDLIIETPEYKNWLAELPAPAQEEEKNWNIQQTLQTQLSEGVSNYFKQSDSNIAAPVAIASFMIGSALVGSVPGIVNNQALFVLTPVQESTVHLAALVPTAMQGSLFLGVNLFALGAIYYAHAESISNSKGSPNPNNPEYVRAFAAAMMKQIRGPEVEKLIGSLLMQQPGSKNFSAEDLKNLYVIAQLSMLSVAMAALYKSQTAWISGMDYAGMITTGKPANDEERVLQREIQNLLKQLPQDVRAKAIEGMMAYMDTNPSIKELMKPSRAFAHAFAEVFNTNMPA